jgi:hypothetical protein
MVRQVPNYARQYLIEHPEAGPPLSKRGAGALAREAAPECSADIPVREARANKTAKREALNEPADAQHDVSRKSASEEPAAKRRKNAAHSVSCGSIAENNPAPKERKNPQREPQETELKRVQAAIAGAERGNWRDLRTVFEFAGIGAQNKDAPS